MGRGTVGAFGWLALLGACGESGPSPALGPSSSLTAPSTTPPPVAPPTAPAAGSPAEAGPCGPVVTDGRLAVCLAIDPAVTVDRVPMRSAVLWFRNTSAEPLRVFLPIPDVFRWGASSITITAPGAPPVLAPEPQPHGYAISERDFFLLAPGEGRRVTQSFTIDPWAPAAGGGARLAGYGRGTATTVRWTLENRTTSFPGGVRTMEGVTPPLFGGTPVPHLWVGRLAVEQTWTIPD